MPSAPIDNKAAALALYAELKMRMTEWFGGHYEKLGLVDFLENKLHQPLRDYAGKKTDDITSSLIKGYTPEDAKACVEMLAQFGIKAEIVRPSRKNSENDFRLKFNPDNLFARLDVLELKSMKTLVSNFEADLNPEQLSMLHGKTYQTALSPVQRQDMARLRPAIHIHALLADMEFAKKRFRSLTAAGSFVQQTASMPADPVSIAPAKTHPLIATHSPEGKGI